MKKKTAGTKIKTYKKQDQEEILKNANFIFDRAKENYQRHKRDLLVIMDDKKRVFIRF